MRFMIEEEVELAFMLIDGAETGRIKKIALKDWVVSPSLIFHIFHSFIDLHISSHGVRRPTFWSIHVVILQCTMPYLSCSTSVAANE